MSYNVLSIPIFDKQLKRLVKKYPSIRNEISRVFQALEENPKEGTPIGNNCFKIRMAIASKGKGKSGGARIITHLKVVQTSVYLLSIYDKSEQEDISNRELQSILKTLPS